MEKYPQFPNEWDDANNTLYRQFHFRSAPDMKTLIRLVKKEFSERGNEGVTRAKLLGILQSYESRLFWKWHQKRKHPKTWWFKIKWRYFTESLHRRFKTKKFKNNVTLCNIAKEVVKRGKKEGKWRFN